MITSSAPCGGGAPSCQADRRSQRAGPALDRHAVGARQAGGHDPPRRRGVRVGGRRRHSQPFRHGAETDPGKIQRGLAGKAVQAQRAAAAQVGAGGDLVGRRHTAPRLDERPFHGADLLRQGHQIAALVAVQDLAPQHHVLRQRSGKLVADRQRAPLVVHVGLQDVARPEPHLPAAAFADAHHREGHLVPWGNRGRGQISPAQAGVRAAGPHQLGVGVADADGIHATYHVVLAVRRKRHLVRAAGSPEVLQSGALQAPRQDPPRQRLG